MKVIEQTRSQAITVLSGLNAILFAGTGGAKWDEWRPQTDLLRGLTGDQIADALNAYWDTTNLDLEQGREWNAAQKAEKTDGK